MRNRKSEERARLFALAFNLVLILPAFAKASAGVVGSVGLNSNQIYDDLRKIYALGEELITQKDSSNSLNRL